MGKRRTRKKLTPRQVAKMAAVYASTASYTEAARTIGVDPTTARRALQRAGLPNRAALHARACARAERRGRLALAENIERLRAVIADSVDEALASHCPPEMEPRDIASLSNAMTNAVAEVSSIRDAVYKRRSSRLTRDKTRAEIKALREGRGLDGAGVTIILPPELHDTRDTATPDAPQEPETDA